MGEIGPTGEPVASQEQEICAPQSRSPPEQHDHSGITEGDMLPDEAQARRDFLRKVGKFALVTPPVITTLLATSMNSDALARSHGGRGPDRGAFDDWIAKCIDLLK